MHGRAASDFASLSGCEQMVTEPTHLDRKVLDLVLTDVPDIVGVWCDSPVGTSDLSVIFIGGELEQLIPHLVYRQEVYLKTYVDWELVRGVVKGLNYNLIIRSSCPVLSLIETLLSVLEIKFPSKRLWLERVLNYDLMTGVCWLTVRNRDNIECVVIIGRRLIERSIEWLIVMFIWSTKTLNEHSQNEANLALLTNAPNHWC